MFVGPGSGGTGGDFFVIGGGGGKIPSEELGNGGGAWPTSGGADQPIIPNSENANGGSGYSPFFISGLVAVVFLWWILKRRK